MPGKSKQKIKNSESGPGRNRPAPLGRAAQRNRTRKAIVDATMRLMASGRMPSIAEVLEEAQVSRRTIYMYFPTVEQLLLDATLGALSQKTIEPVIGASGSSDAVTRAEQLSRAINSTTTETMHLGRALIRLTVEGTEPRSGLPRRGYRRIGWIEQAVEPLRGKVNARDFERLVSALTVLMGWEPMILLKDLRALNDQEAEDVLAFAVRAVVQAAMTTSGDS